MDLLPDDAQLWRDARGGDGRAFGDLFDRHYGRVFRHVLGLVDQAADADEVAASTFLELWRRRDAVRVVSGSVLPWLLVTGGNLARNAFRRRRRYGRLIAELLADAAPFAADPADIVHERQAMRDALRRMRPADAEILLLAADLPLEDVAAALAIAPGTARVRLHRARARLRAAVEVEPIETLLEGPQ